MDSKKIGLFLISFLVIVAVGFGVALLLVKNVAENMAQQVFDPVQKANDSLRTQVAEFLHPTPTIVPDPVTIIHEVRSLARLETVQYSVEKVITAEIRQDIFAPLFGDKLLFIAHGVVIAGVDLENLKPEDLWLENDILYVRLPQAEVFIATLDNDKSFVYDRETGLFTHGDVNLETTARQAAEEEIAKAALEDGILDLAQQNAENYLGRLIRGLGFTEVIFVQ
jgi:hypothetical protein